MAPGVGGFNIDLPVPRASLATGKAAVAHTRRRELPLAQAPIQAQRMAVTVESGGSSSVLNLLVIIAIVGLMLLVFRDEARNQLSNILEAVTPLYTVFSSERSAHQARLVVEPQKGFANEPLPLGISLKDASGVETVTVGGLAQDTELSLGTSLGPAGSCRPAILTRHSSAPAQISSASWTRLLPYSRPVASFWIGKLFDMNGYIRNERG